MKPSLNQKVSVSECDLLPKGKLEFKWKDVAQSYSTLNNSII